MVILIYRNFKYDENTVLIGSSFGGYIANIFSAQFDIPCLLFNPALAFRSIAGIASCPEENVNNIKSLTYTVLGKKDTIISAELNCTYIKKYFKGPVDTVIEPNMKHRVPLPIFQKHIKRFFSRHPLYIMPLQ